MKDGAKGQRGKLLSSKPIEFVGKDIKGRKRSRKGRDILQIKGDVISI